MSLCHHDLHPPDPRQPRHKPLQQPGEGDPGPAAGVSPGEGPGDMQVLSGAGYSYSDACLPWYQDAGIPNAF